MVILDTNVISEVLLPAPNPAVSAWFAAQNSADVYTTSISEAELLFGVELLPHGKRRNHLANAVTEIIRDDFGEQVLPFNRAAAQAYATIKAGRQKAGRKIRSLDGQIAAIAQSVGADVATRNVAHFENCGINIINPWEKM